VQLNEICRLFRLTSTGKPRGGRLPPPNAIKIFWTDFHDSQIDALGDVKSAVQAYWTPSRRRVHIGSTEWRRKRLADYQRDEKFLEQAILHLEATRGNVYGEGSRRIHADALHALTRRLEDVQRQLREFPPGHQRKSGGPAGAVDRQHALRWLARYFLDRGWPLSAYNQGVFHDLAFMLFELYRPEHRNPPPSRNVTR
jgi:hypothetical protein